MFYSEPVWGKFSLQQAFGYYKIESNNCLSRNEFHIIIYITNVTVGQTAHVGMSIANKRNENRDSPARRSYLTIFTLTKRNVYDTSEIPTHKYYLVFKTFYSETCIYHYIQTRP